MAREYLERPEFGSSEPAVLPEDWEENTRTALTRKHRKLLRWKHPEPGTAFSYQDWRSGANNTQAVVEMPSERVRQCHESDDGFVIVDMPPDSSNHVPYTIRLEDTFRNQGLQVIIKIDGVELTPENPKYQGSDWQLEGQKNEHIVAVAVHAYDVQNVTESRIAFRQETFLYTPDYVPDRTNKDYNRWTRPTHEHGKSNDAWAEVAEMFGFNPWD